MVESKPKKKQKMEPKKQNVYEELPTVHVEEEVIKSATSSRFVITVADSTVEGAFKILMKIKKEFKK